MPIKPENLAKYPADWQDVRARVRSRSGNKCEWCGVANFAMGGRSPDGAFHKSLPLGEKLYGLEWPRAGDFAWCEDRSERLRIVKIVLTVAHLDHDPTNNVDSNLAHLCQKCHLTYDAKLHAQNAAITRRKDNAIGELF